MSSNYIPKKDKSKVYYHGSPNSNLTYLAANTYITPYMYLAIEFGRYHLYTHKTWSDSDLVKPYNFIEGPYFKEDCIPKGIPTIYKVIAHSKDIDFLSNPFEHLIKIEVKVEKLRLFNICNL
jgi:hypothetical protein